MKKATKHVIAALAEGGSRITAARREIVATLADAAEPLTINQLTKLVGADEASVYRTIATLTDKGLLEEIVVKGGKSKFALVHGHHHHAICRDCGYVEHVACEKAPLHPKQLVNFARLDEHDVTFYGLCKNCAS